MAQVYIFPGQGSQKVGMGDTLFDRYESRIKEADKCLGFSIKELCLKDPKNVINQTQYTQVALYTVNALSYHQLIDDGGDPADFLAGHSLGEYNALYSAGAFDFITGLEIVAKRGKLMSQASGGKMAAIIGLPLERIKQILSENGFDSIDLANLNAPLQTVISGLEKDVLDSEAFFKKAQATFIPLNVSGAFHSRYMKEAQDEFASFLETVKFSKLEKKVLANVDAKPYLQETIKRNLVDQISNPVRWVETIRLFLQLPTVNIREVGPGKVLTSLVRKIKSS